MYFHQLDQNVSTSLGPSFHKTIHPDGFNSNSTSFPPNDNSSLSSVTLQPNTTTEVFIEVSNEQQDAAACCKALQRICGSVVMSRVHFNAPPSPPPPPPRPSPEWISNCFDHNVTINWLSKRRHRAHVAFNFMLYIGIQKTIMQKNK